MKTTLYTFCIIAVFFSFQKIFSQTPEQQSILAKAERYDKNGWIFLHVEGTPRERGFQHGFFLAKEITDAIGIQKKVWEYQSAIEWSWMIRQADSLFTPKIDAEFLAEIDGISEGMSAAKLPMSREELIAYNSASELLGSWWPLVKDSLSPNAPLRSKESCSSFIATGSMTRDGKIVLAHNTWSDFYYAVFNIVMDIQPEHGHRILWQTGAGLIHSGTDFFITDAGLVGSETTLGDFKPFDASGIPEFARMRKATQYASSLDEWCEIMNNGNNGGYANAWLVGDINTNEIARLELGLRHIGFERTKDGYFSGSNIAEDLKILRMETSSNEQNIKNPSVARRVRWKMLMKEHKGLIDVEKAKMFLGDHYDSYLKKNIPSSRTICGHWELDNQAFGSDEPFRPLGAFDGKVVDATMAKKMMFTARWGAPCGMPFFAEKFLREHSQFEWMNGMIFDRPKEAWTIFSAKKK